ncbi:MAG: GAF domain-containing protein [Spirochaetales bacterium]|nr:GAF domain-containing protein [Spirochaetales bacterium]
MSELFHAKNLPEVLPLTIAQAAGAVGAQAAALILMPGGFSKQAGSERVQRPSGNPPKADAGRTRFRREPHLNGVSSVITYGLPDEALHGKALATELLVSLGLQEENPVAIGDYSHYVFAHTSLVELGATAVLASPLIIAGELSGLLLLLRISEDRPFSSGDARFIQILSTALSARMENLRLRQLDRDVRDEVEAVQRTSSTLTASLELPTVLDSILASAHELVPADLAHIFLYDGKQLSFGAASGQDGRWDEPFAEPRREGLTYRVAETGKPIVVEDIRTHPLYRDSPKKWRGSIVGLPLEVKQRIVGVMNISRFESQPFNDEELRILEMLADQAAIAIENARLYQAERTQRRHIEAMQSAVASLSQSLDLREVLDRLLTELRKVIPYDSASVMLVEGSSLRVVAGRDLPGDAAIGKEYPLTEIEREIEQSGRPFILVDAAADARFHGWGNTAYVRGWMSVPLLGRAGLIGCLTIDSRKLGAYSDEEADLAMSFAHQAAIAVENAQLHQNVKDQLGALQASQVKLVQSEKMAAIGKLVAGVAHELNNPLTAIIGIAQLLQTGKVDSRVRQDLEKLVAEAHRAGKIVRSLLDFSRQKRPERGPVLVDDVLDSTLKILGYELQSRNVECRVELAGNLPATMADANQLQQVFVNLICNAYEAMFEANGGGLLTVTSELVGIDQTSRGSRVDGDASTGAGAAGAGMRGRRPVDRLIRVCIGDDGPGIPEEVQPRVFDPFFTTKSPGKGTGLGLSVCHGIIGEHGGQIWLESRPGEGTRFYVQIPLVSVGEHAVVDADTPGDQSEASGIGRILVVEDEEVVRSMVARVLGQAGYQVETSADGWSALEKIAARDYDLIICDVRMPELSGIDLYKKLSSERSEAPERFLFITGDTVSSDTVGFIEENHVSCLGKPFEIQDLLEAVRQELQQ